MASALQKLAPLSRRLTGQRVANAAPRRSFAADAHGEEKINFWESPMEVGRWKEEQTVLVVLAGWGVGIYSAMKIFGKKKEEVPAAPTA
ncbi:hypothetical protein ACKKBG_A06730 [Auxenochlorella protothecoides x Auxenochlorella symbiontica]